MNEQWNKALEQVDDQYISEAAAFHPKRHWIKIVGSLAAVLVLAVSWSILRPVPPDTTLTVDANPTTSSVLPTDVPPVRDPIPSETQPTPTLPEETQPIPTLPLPTETQPIPTLPLPEEDPPTTTPSQSGDSANPPDVDTSITISGIVSPHQLILPNLAAAPTYPVQAKCPDPEAYSDLSNFYDAQQHWQYQVSLQKVKSPDNIRDLDPFMKSAMAQFMSGSGNQVCSPMNIYFALSMLAETTGGNTRQQILELLGHSSIESLRAQANQLWQAHYYDNGQTTSLMANSLWLDEDYSFTQSTLNTLASSYFASVFEGDLGSTGMNQQLVTWLNSQTGNLLSNYTQDIQLDPATVFCLVSTTYFSADWNSTFNESRTIQELFHCNGYDIIADFMHKTFSEHRYYYDSIYSAIPLDLADDHTMWLILPEEGYTPTDVLKQGNYYQMITNRHSWEGQGLYTVNLSLPKFDISKEIDLQIGLQAMGITDVFNGNANFSPLTDAALALSEATHAARVTIDEEGVIAAAYTILSATGATAPTETEEVDFVLDRPFLFVITGDDDLPLFSGVVSNP